MPAGIEPRLAGRPAFLDPRHRQPRRQDRHAEPAAFAERRRRDHAAPKRQVGKLHRTGPQLRHLHLEILAIVGDGATAPQASDEVDRLLHALAAVVAAQPMADKFVLVVNRALAHSDIDPAPAKIVEQRQLDGEPHRVMEGQLHDGEADPDPLGAHCDRRGEQQRVVVYQNVETVTADADLTATFHLKRPQPAIIALLASGYAPVYPCHVSPRDMRQHPIGTGPFKFVEFKPNEYIKVARNPDYWKRDRPYLDGIEYTVIPNRSTAILSFIAGKFDMTFPFEVTV